MLMTADEKINELQSILEAKALENDELKVAMQTTGGSQSSGLPSNEIMQHVKAAMQDLQQMNTNPQMYVQLAAKKLQGISSLIQGN